MKKCQRVKETSSIPTTSFQSPDWQMLEQFTSLFFDVEWNSNVQLWRYGLEAVRYFLLREGGYVNDGDFSEELLTLRYENDLADTFGTYWHTDHSTFFVDCSIFLFSWHTCGSYWQLIGNLVSRCLSTRLHPNNNWPRLHQSQILPLDTQLITKIKQLPRTTQ